jgi:predicted permease
VWLLSLVSSKDAAQAVVGDVFEELDARRAEGRTPRLPRVWITVQLLRAVALETGATLPRLRRSCGLIVRDAVRALRASPAHSSLVVLVLAAGITLATVTFSVVDAVVLRPLPVDQADRLVSIQTWDPSARKGRVTPDLFWRLHDQLGSVEALAAQSRAMGVMITVADVRDEGAVARVTADMFSVLRLSPGIGRLWTAADEEHGNQNVAVLGYRFWRDRLHGDPSILGKTVSVDVLRPAYTVIGVLSPASDHPEVDITSPQLWVPLALPRSPSNTVSFGVVARMRPGVSVSEVADAVQALAGAPGWRPEVAPLLDGYVKPVRHWMLLALGAALLVVVVACANAANLILRRSAARTQEMAIRASLGASRTLIATSVLAEGLLLTAVATGAALLLSLGGVRLARIAVTAALPGLFRSATIALDGHVLGVAIIGAALTGLVCSLVPAWQASRTSVAALLKDSDSVTATGRHRWRSVFLVAEIAAVVVLLVVSWLFVASLVRVVGVDLGIERPNLLAVNPRVEFRATVGDIERTIRALPGVSDVAVSRRAMLPLVSRAFGGAWPTTTLERADRPGGASPPATVDVLDNRVTPNYFRVVGLTFRRGAAWAADGAGAESAVVLDDRAAVRIFGDDNPLGRQVLAHQPAAVYTVVGVVSYVYTWGPEAEAPPAAYFDLRRDPGTRYAALFARTSRPASTMVPLVARALDDMRPDLKEPFVFAADEAMTRLTATRWFNAQLMSVFGLAGMLIGAAGVYAVMASFVAEQTREIGVRLALGATPARIQRSVLRLTVVHLAAGLTIGLPLAWSLSRGFAALLFQVTPADTSVYVGVSTLIGLVAVLAAWIPARRAATIDPMISLRR